MLSTHLLPIRVTEIHTDCEDWPAFLVALASNGCGDFFAYDLRTSPNRIIYIDPDRGVDENLAADDKLQYDSFDCWHAAQTERHNGPKANARNA